MSNPTQPTHRSLTGIVTKLVGDGATYGFINDEIFFPQTNVVSGGPASVGDQVFAECEYSAHLPIKWNATSVKILNKGPAMGQAGPDNRQQQQQQDMMNQQQQQQFNQPPQASVAVTYQQHRQQRQQRQMLGDVDHRPQQNDNKNEQGPRLLDQNQGDFPPGMGGPFQNQPHPLQPPPESIMGPFQVPQMDGSNFMFTSQPGSAFVQNQFLPPPFLAQQQPPPLLPQTQHLLPQNNQSSNNNQNQRNNNINNNNNNKGGNRFNNSNNNNIDKNDRQQQQQGRNRNQNRNNDNKFDRMRSGDRDSPADRSRGNNRGSRDRSTGRGGRKDPPTRPSPPPQSSARSTTSSDRAIKSSRRHYEPQNIPKTRIMTNMNAYNMKQRCPSSVHVPSDLKDILVNRHFRLDIRNTPKPLRFIIEDAESGKTKKDDAPQAEVKTDPSQAVDDKPSDSSLAIKQEESGSDGSTTDAQKTQEQPTPPSSKSDIRLNHKYGVKVILISMPEFDSIYRKVFGQDLDSYTSDGKSRSRLDEAISLLCTKGSNNGHSLIGGKFDPVLDGFVEGKNNRFERHGRHPDLIATCKRVVLEQTGLDLGPCRGWNLLSTFIYNNKSDYFSSKASIEYSYIYMPQIWTMLKDGIDTRVGIPVELAPPPVEEESFAVPEQKAADQDSVDALMEVSQEEPMKSNDLETENKQDESSEKPEAEVEEVEDARVIPIPATQESSLTTPSSSFDTSNIYEMKRDDLKIELDKRDVKYKPSAKKAELLVLLEEVMRKEKEDSSSAPASESKPSTEETATSEPTAENAQLEEGEVLENDPSEDSDDGDLADAGEKRKADETDEQPDSKKLRTDEVDGKTSTPNNKTQRVELITQAFIVKSRDEHQLSLVSLYDASQVSRHDQFELSVASNILKESLVQHLSEYILTTLVEDCRQQSSAASISSQQESLDGSTTTACDTNNNASKSAQSNAAKATPDTRPNSKEYPVDRYINLAFSYFDSTHMGYVYSDDLNKLFNNTDLTISKRALASLLGDSDKFNYRTLADLSPKLPATYTFEFPEQFRLLPGDNNAAPGSSPSSSAAESPATTTKMIEYKGVVYDIEKLAQEVREAETLRVSMVDRFNYAIENSDKQAEEIHVLEVSQKSLSKAIKSQNDEICDLKRERDSIKRKYEALRKGIKSSVGSLSDLIKEDK